MHTTSANLILSSCWKRRVPRTWRASCITHSVSLDFGGVKFLLAGSNSSLRESNSIPTDIHSMIRIYSWDLLTVSDAQYLPIPRRFTSVLRIGILSFTTLVFGIFACGFWYQDVLTAQRVNTQFVEATCVVEGKVVDKQESGSERSTAPRSVLGYSACVQIRYTVAGEEYLGCTLDGVAGYYDSPEDAQAAMHQFTVGNEYPCWYDPQEPERVVLIRRDSYAGNYVVFALLAVLALGSGTWLAISVWQKISGSPASSSQDDQALPRCPKCQGTLKTALARQCFQCGHSWHE